jgi:hypothetical protein
VLSRVLDWTMVKTLFIYLYTGKFEVAPVKALMMTYPLWLYTLIDKTGWGFMLPGLIDLTIKNIGSQEFYDGCITGDEMRFAALIFYLYAEDCVANPSLTKRIKKKIWQEYSEELAARATAEELDKLETDILGSEQLSGNQFADLVRDFEMARAETFELPPAMAARALKGKARKATAIEERAVMRSMTWWEKCKQVQAASHIRLITRKTVFRIKAFSKI